MNYQEFNLGKIKNGYSISIIGNKGAGKTNLAKDILTHKLEPDPIGIVIGNTSGDNYESIGQYVFTHDEFKTEILDKVFRRQEKALSENWKNPYIFTVFDNCFYKTLNDDNKFKELFFNGRFYKILNIITLLPDQILDDSLRDQIDLAFIFYTNNKVEREKLYNDYSNIFSMQKSFDDTIDLLKDDKFKCIVIQEDMRTNVLNKLIFLYKAKDYSTCTKSVK